MPDVTSIVFIVETMSRARIAGLLISTIGWRPKPLPRRRNSCRALAPLFRAVWCSTSRFQGSTV